MNRFLVTGMALGREVGVCRSCDFDLSWLIRYPSVLLWADAILVTETIWDVASSGRYDPAMPELSLSVKLVFEMARDEGIIRVVDPKHVITPALRDAILDEVSRDRTLLAETFPEHVTLGDEDRVPGQVFINEHEYCAPHIWTIYAGFVLARAWSAQCLFGARVFNYCRYKFGLAGLPEEGRSDRLDAFQSVFQAYLPNSPILPEYVLEDKGRCSTCANERSCRGAYLAEVEARLKRLFSWRDYDEIHQFRHVVSRIVERQQKWGNPLDSAEVMQDVKREQQELLRRLRRVFPAVKRWANVAAMVSMPVAAVGSAVDYPLITVPASVLAGLSKASEALVRLLESRYRWAGFLSKTATMERTTE